MEDQLLLRTLQSFMRIDAEQADLNRARYRALSKQLPLMYGIVTINMIGLSATHATTAPLFLTVVFPIFLFAITVARTTKYIRSRHKVFSDEQIHASLTRTTWLVVPLALAFSIWGISFLPYGSPDQNAQALFFNSVSVIACAFCLMHIRAAAMLVLATVIPVTCIFLFMQNSFAYSNVAINLTLVALVLASILSSSERDFTQMILQKREQREQHLRLQALYEENKRLANTDSLTTLANRRQFLADIDDLVEKNETASNSFVVALLDLDGFKQVNDVFGHPAGDQVLVETAHRLNETFQDQNVLIARLGGDEFGLLFREPGSDDEVKVAARRACMALRKSYQFDEGSANLGATIGMARYPSAADTRSLLFDRADYALYYAKQNAKSEPVFFTVEHEQMVFANSALEQALRHADLEAEMSVEFQPVLDLDRGHSRGLEALARWFSPTLGNVRPDIFIKAAENIGMIGRLTEVLFRKAVSEARLWPGDLTLSFNLSAVSLTSVEPLMRLFSIAQKQGFPANRLVFEITESAVMKDFESANVVLNYIRESGAHVAIDDFGTGFSSLAYVHRLPIDTLKVDRSFIRDLLRNEKSSNVLRSILSLCENLEIGCIIEGVETQEQFDLVCELGGRNIQGYYYSKPLSAGDAHMVLQIEFGDDHIESHIRQAV